MPNPYEILGVSHDATEEQVTQAYRKLAKKYHPDLNPGNKSAEEKMRQINAAYEQISKQKHGGATYEQHDGSYTRDSGQSAYGGDGGGGGSYWGYGGGGGPFQGFGFDFEDFFGGGGQRQSTGSVQYREVIQLINSGQYNQAIYALSRIQSRAADWYYYSAIANAGAGNRVTAMNHARTAVRMAPNNAEYQRLLSQFEQGSFQYRQTGQNYGFDMSNMGSSVMRLCLAQLLCMFCCNGRICC